MSDTQKHNKPNVPNLRFPEFSGDWETRKIGQDCTVNMCKRIFANQTSEKGEVPFYKIGTIGGLPDSYISRVLFEEYKSKYNYPHKGEVMITCAGTVGKTIVFDGEDAYYQDSNIVWLSNPKQLYINPFLNYCLSRVNWNKLNSTTITRIYNDNLRELTINYPSVKEQEKIVSVLSLIDQRIDIQNKVIEKYESLIKALTQEAHKRATSSYFLRDVLAERKELNSKGYDICSVSVSKGVINQIEYLGRSFAAKETKHYHVVRHGDVVYTKSPTGDFPYGIIKQNYNDNPAAVSPLYGVYEPITYEVGVYLHYYFCSPNNALNYLHPLIQKGAKNTINITNQHFLDNKVRIPDSKVLSKTVSTIITISSRLQLEERVLYQLQLQKQFLLSNMFI